MGTLTKARKMALGRKADDGRGRVMMTLFWGIGPCVGMIVMSAECRNTLHGEERIVPVDTSGHLKNDQMHKPGVVA